MSCLFYSPYGVPHQPAPILSHHHHHHHPMANVINVDPQIPLQLSSVSAATGIEGDSITLLESGPSELKKTYPQSHDHNNNGNSVYQNLTTIHSNQIKAETLSPIDGASSAKASARDCKHHGEPVHMHVQADTSDLSVEAGNERSRCWTKI